MLIHKAWYGPKGGHALLSSTAPGLQAVFRQAAWLTDLPGTVPTGLQWQPYFRTAIHGSYFVLVHTRNSRDTTRAGMVDSVAAFISLTELPLVPDLRELADNLRDSHDSDNHTPFVPMAQAAAAPANPHHPLLLEMANALISAKQRPVIHIGQAGFDDIALDLLQVVPKQLRREVLFSLSFSPEDTGASVTVAVPEELASRYPQGQVLSASSEPPSTSVAAVLNMPEGRPLLDFGEAAAFDLQSANSLILLEQAFRLWESPIGVGDAITLVRLLATKSGDSQRASDVRKVALDRLTSTSERWTPVDVLSMRNLQLERFDTSTLTAAVEAWVRKRVNEAAKTEDDCHLFDQAARGAAQQKWWNIHVRAGYVSAINDKSAGIGALAWEAIEKVPEGIEPVFALFDAEGKLQALASTVPAVLSLAVAAAAAQESAKRGAWQLCGVALAAAYAPPQALSAVLTLAPPNGARRLAIESALLRTSPSDRVAIAVREDIEEVTALAADVVTDDPNLLCKFDWALPVWFDILDKAVATSRSIAAEVPDRLQGLQTVIQSGERSDRVWGPLARAGLADLSHVANRADAWKLIPRALAAAVLGLTAEGWLAGLLDGTVSVDGLEEPLRSEVSSALKDNTLMASLAQKSPALFINVINELHPLSDYECVTLLDSLARAPGHCLGLAPATALGKLIRNRYWTSAAARAASYGRSRDDFLPVCRECLSTMTFWDSVPLSWRIGKPVQIPADEAWQMLEETLAELYPQGPTHNEIWSRSGGKDEQLSLEGNGVAQWHRCIKQVRAGRGPAALDLLRIALRDFSGNPVLQVLRDSHAIESIDE
ncbi:effector-associated domain EAD1-containing protein [Burkholderia cepacia]|uniref:GAP1-N1 domain-containing protein n=1 Tax=Burkholderia cepacia TaxID=292 RepID=UPI001CF1BA59|nr:effector-associated domain EAD1-containing protein [Burkholderia cepacia]MCA7933966.1 effector-associated domain EAD1-containing protein [Burkholderia cepacia]